MIFNKHNIHKRMRQITNRQIEKAAVAVIINYLKNHFENIVFQSVKELDQLNKQREKHKIYMRSRIGADCSINAIYTIRQKNPDLYKKIEEKTKKKEKEKKYFEILRFLAEMDKYE